MAALTQIQIKEIADQLDFGFRCFWNQDNNELVFIPDLIKHPEMDEFYQDDIEKVDCNFGNYVEIQPMESYESFQIMAEFIDSLQYSNKLKNKLTFALTKKKPFREFKFTIDNSGPFRQQWFDFKNKKLKEWVCKKIDELTDNEREKSS